MKKLLGMLSVLMLLSAGRIVPASADTKVPGHSSYVSLQHGQGQTHCASNDFGLEAHASNNNSYVVVTMSTLGGMVVKSVQSKTSAYWNSMSFNSLYPTYGATHSHTATSGLISRSAQ